MDGAVITWTAARWADYMFDRPVTAPEWYGVEDDLPDEPVPAEAVAFLTELFEHAGERLAPYTNAQLNQGFWYLLGSGASGLTRATHDPTIPVAAWVRCVRALITLFAQVFAPRCSPHLGHRDEPDTDPLNLACYMWWDLLPLPALPDGSGRAALHGACLDVLAATLDVDSAPCRESALHGLGHWTSHNPERVADIIDRFLAAYPGLRPELLAYARAARGGCVL